MNKKLNNLKRSKQSQTKQNTYIINSLDSKVINLTKIQLNSNETNILAAGYKYDYPEKNNQIKHGNRNRNSH